MERLAIIADDLTGAADAGVRFARQGLTTIVTWGAGDPEFPLPAADVLVLNTDSRAMAAAEAYACAKEAALRLKSAGYRHVYKKIDSTLRGNWGAEVDAVMDVFGCELAIVAPAFPRMGRTTAAGVHYLQGVPVAETEIARDPKCPVRDSDLVKLLSAQTKRPVGLVRLGPAGGDQPSVGLQGGGSRSAVREQAERLAKQGVQLLVCDAQTEDDLERIAAAFVDFPHALLWVGSAGLAEYWPGEWVFPAKDGFAQDGVRAQDPVLAETDILVRDHSSVKDTVAMQDNISPDVSPRTIPLSDRPVMLVAGSVSDVSAEQIARMKLAPNVAGVEFDPSAAAGGAAAAASEIDRCREEIARAIARGRDVAFHVGASPAAVAASRAAAAARGVTAAELAAAISGALGEVAAAIVREHRLAGLILTGGDTAIAVCRALSAEGLRLVAELEPGIPLNALAGGAGDGLPAVTKAGAFGNADTFVHALDVLKGKRQTARPDIALD